MERIMQNDKRDGSGAALARGFAALCAVLAVGLGLMAAPATAAPFAYVANSNDAGTISVIDTATNTVVATVTVGPNPRGVAVTPDGKHAYVTNLGPVFLAPGSVSVIETTGNTVVATVAVGGFPGGVAVTPDGEHAYVTGSYVSVIETASNKLVAAIGVGGRRGGRLRLPSRPMGNTPTSRM